MTRSPKSRKEQLAAAQGLLEETRASLRRLTTVLSQLADETQEEAERGQLRLVNGKAVQALGWLNSAEKLPGLPPAPKDQGDG